MRIACPSCAAAYEVPDAALAGGPRRLRCAKCGHVFIAEPPPAPAGPAPGPAWRDGEPSAAAPPAPPDDPVFPGPPPDMMPEAPDLPPAELPPRPPPARGPARASPIDPPLPPPNERPAPPPDRVAVLGWVLTVVMLVAAAVILVIWRDDIMTAWPPVQRVYDALGLT